MTAVAAVVGGAVVALSGLLAYLNDDKPSSCVSWACGSFGAVVALWLMGAMR